MDIAELLKAIESRINGYRREEKKIFTSSSFQTHSIPLLHILVTIDRDIPVYFLNTGYHFPETILFRDRIVQQLGLRMIDLKPETPKSMQKGSDGKLLFTSDPDHCCYINKTLPMDKVLMAHDVWINGVRADQSTVRKNMQEEMPAPHNTLRYHPMLPWTPKMIYEYRKKYDLPEHPLDAMGYMSIGCEPCTRRFDPEMQEREVRWYGLKKTECGLHTDLINPNN
jgi:phosphoadenosine phosphosulfate reductase